MPQDNATNRSFPLVRMTGFRFVVILTEGKDLFVVSRDDILKVPWFSVKNHEFCQGEPDCHVGHGFAMTSSQ